MNEPSISLSDNQLSIMRVLWGQGEADTQNVCDQISTDRKQPAYTTVSTLLKRLEKRGLVTHRQDGRKQVFRALVTEAQVRSSMVSELVGTLFRGDSRALVSHLVNENEVGAGDLEVLKQMIEKGQTP